MKGERQKFAKFLSLSLQERLLFLEAFVLQMWVGLLLKVIPFRWIPRLFSGKGQGAGGKGQGDNEPETINDKQETLLLLKAATQRASRVAPWKNRCLVSSLAARRMMSRRKIVSRLSLGVTRDKKGNVIAHAWVRAGEMEIVSAQTGFTELYCF